MFNHWPSIESFHRVVKDNKYALEETEYGVESVLYKGKVKLHGTNSAINIKSSGRVYAQSRSRIITPGPDDNCGFAAYVEEYKEEWAKNANPKFNITIYGEWCGKGIQKGVAISKIDRKVFAVFAIQVGSSDSDASRVIVDPKEIARAMCYAPEGVYILPWYSEGFFEVKFEQDLNSIVEVFNQHVADVEECDPWVKDVFGVEDIGEGLVYFPISFSDEKGSMPRGDFTRFMFKAKGTKHKSQKTRSSVSVDPEVVKSVEEFINMFATENRFEQGVIEGTSGIMDYKQIGPFIGWVFKDIKKESVTELEVANLCWKQVTSAIANRARKWYINKCEEL